MDREREAQPSSAALGIKILQALGVLQDSPTGSVVYQEVERLLDRLEESHLRSEQAYATVAGTLLEVLLEHTVPDTPLHTELKLLQARLRPPLVEGEDDILREQVTRYAAQLLARRGLEPDSVQRALGPLLQAQREQGQQGPDGRFEEPGETQTDRHHDSLPSMSAHVFNAVDQRRQKMRELHDSLSEEIHATIAENQEFGVMLDLVIGELQHVGNANDIEGMRQHLLDQIKRLRQGHFGLAEKLASTDRYLQLMESDSQHLDDELARTRLLSLTDELTELPNRRAFMNRLEDEVARVQRYGMPLSLAVIDLDDFKAINDEYGHAAGDEVLRCYANAIFNVLRHHDMVARYGGEEFAILFPNTEHQGAVSALTKIQDHAAEIQCDGPQYSLSLPSFSAGVATYHSGEPPSRLIERADQVLYKAKRLGKNRMEVDAEPGGGEREREVSGWPSSDSSGYSTTSLQ